MILLTTDWGQAWSMAGMSVGVVFTILILLVIVLTFFSWVAKANTAKAIAAPVAAPTKSAAKASDADEAAVAMAVYLYLNGRHDEESGVLTIQVNDHSLWHEELNDRL